MRRVMKNVAKSPPITKQQAERVAAKEIWKRELNADDIQIIKRICSSVDSGLKFGAPPPLVGA